MAWKTEKNTHKNPAGGRVSSAAYNFVELPEKVISAVENVEELPRHNTYANPNYLNTGYFLIRLTTKTQLYVRCPLTPSQNRAKADDDRKQNYKDKISNQPEFFYTSETSKPVIPGSSLRGMLRNLLEIVSYGKVNFVQSKPKMFYRAVATTDSIGRLYKERTKDIETGFLIKRNDEWLGQPAIKPQSIWGNFETKPYLPIKDIFVQGKLSGFLHFDHPNYKPKIYRISFDGIGKHFTDRRERKRKLVEITQVGDRSQSYAHNGFLVTSGNMLENAPAGSRSDRKKHAIILEADLNQSEIKINSQAVKDYKDSLTDFMQEKFDKKFGYLKDGNPIFYLEENGEVIAFGHTPNFRLPALFNSENRVVSPLDFVPLELREEKQIDFAEAMFGRERKQAIASRVFVTDAKCLQTTDVFEETITPPILASPKPTAFQHYLTQSNEYNLKHYASKTHEETVIRGHKLYWHRGKNAFDDLKAKDNPSEQSTQHTRFKPVKPGVSFEFKIYFENLSNEELGVLCWVLHPNGESGETYYHKLGMGKAFGMGAVELTADLHLTERSWAEDSAETKRNSRYGQLFDDENNWQTGENSDDQSKWQSFVDSFEKKILAELTEMSKNRLAEVDRIKMLLKMLEWEENFDDRIKRTLRLEEFKDRNVLPNPLDTDETISEGKTGQTEANPDSNKKIGTVRVLGSLPKTKQ